jgi:hypothetical protein
MTAKNAAKLVQFKFNPAQGRLFRDEKSMEISKSEEVPLRQKPIRNRARHYL